MKILAVLLAVLLIAPACLADTLRHLLVNQGIPLSSFQESELQENVEELMVSDAKSTVLTYWVLKDKQLPSPLSFVIYDRPSGLVLRKDLQLSECCPARNAGRSRCEVWKGSGGGSILSLRRQRPGRKSYSIVESLSYFPADELTVMIFTEPSSISLNHTSPLPIISP